MYQLTLIKTKMIYNNSEIITVMPDADEYIAYLTNKYGHVKWIYYTETIDEDIFCYMMSIFVSSKGDVLLQESYNKTEDEDETDDELICDFYERRIDIIGVELDEEDYKLVNTKRLKLENIKLVLKVIDDIILKKSDKIKKLN